MRLAATAEREPARDAARRGIPAPLRRDVRMLGAILGDVIAAYGGRRLLKDVESLRRTVIRAREDDAEERQAERIVASWSVERAEEVARAFTCYFHLVNLAEEHHRARVLRERDRGGRPQPESLAATVNAVRRNHGERKLRSLVAGLELHPVFTAHPTEARRRAVVTAIRRAGDQLDLLDDPRASAAEAAEARRRLVEEVEILWRTSQLRTTQVQPLDEVRTVMAVFDETIFRAVPEIYRSLDRALQPEHSGTRAPMAPAFLRFGSWVGGDRDGNDAITAAVTLETMEVQAEHVLLAYEAAATRIGRALTADATTTPANANLHRRLAALSAADPGRMAEHAKRSPDELHRQFLLHVADRIRATRVRGPLAYVQLAGLLDDLRTVQASLRAAGASRLAFGELQHLVWQAETFGLHLAELEVRQHSHVHASALAEIRGRHPHSAQTEELLATFRAMSALQSRFGVEACNRYVVSFTRDVDDIAAVHELASIATHGRPPALQVVPLFETLDDLDRAADIADAMLDLDRESSQMQVMLGYSDSTKEVGPLTATLALYRAQASLAVWAARRRVKLTIFHGRGGALGRGGGPANRAVRAQAPGSVNGRFKVTEQGEVIFARYGNAAIARRHLEQVASAVIEASIEKPKRGGGQFDALAEAMSSAARAAYRGLVDAPGFETWFGRVSPIRELGRMRIASRRQRRKPGHRLEDLRAIPWVFAWSQMRLNLPGWYGLGSGLAAAPIDELRRAYMRWPLFNVLLDNAEMSLAKTDRRIAARYLALGDRPELASRVLEEYDLTRDRVLAVTKHRRLLENRRVLSWAVELRNPYVDALSHLQLRALRELRSKGASKSAERLFLLSVNGVAAGLQNTG